VDQIAAKNLKRKTEFFAPEAKTMSTKTSSSLSVAVRQPAKARRSWCHQRPVAEGRLLGEQMARMAAPHIERMLATFPNERPPCADCAFVKGTEANGWAVTGMNALKCVVEGDQFFCHQGKDGTGDPKHVCSGWLACRLGIEVAKQCEGMTPRK